MYKVVIGLEVHCELKTNAKVFSPAKNTYTEEPNINVSAIDMGFPGIMPVINEKAAEQALKMSIALNCNTPDEVMFDRKNYFYPDLPKGFQITQVTKPMGKKGYLIVNVDGEDKRVDINQLHLEEDTASLDHYGNYSLLDYNRSGIPLLEIVTEPCMHSSKEALALLEVLRSIILYCDVSEAKTDKGQMRCDVNVSLMKEDASEFGTKVEIKNINSFNNVKDAIEYEIKRQTEILENGQNVVMETRRFDDDSRTTLSMRTKVEAVDYKYFVEPNIVPVKIKETWLKDIQESIPMLPYERVNLYMEKYELPRYDATIIVKDKAIADFFEEAITHTNNYKYVANWINGIIMGHLNKYEQSINELYLTPKMLVELIEAVEKKVISIKQAKDVLYTSLTENKAPLDIIKSSNMSQIQDEGEIRNIVTEVLDENPDVIEKYKSGRGNVLDYFVGQIMKKTRGKANPEIAAKILREEIDKR